MLHWKGRTTASRKVEEYIMEMEKDNPTKTKTPNKGVLRLLTLIIVLIWAAAWIFMKIGLAYMGPFTLSALRFISGSATLLILLFFLKRLSVKNMQIRDLVILGFIQTTAVFALVQYGLVFVDAGKTSVLLYSMPIWSAAMAAKFLDEKLSGVKITAMILGAIGLVLIVGFDASAIRDQSVFVGELLVIVAAVFWATANIFYQKKFHDADRIQVNAYQMLFGAIGLTIAAITMEWGEPVEFNAISIFTILFTGILGSAVNFSIWFYLLTVIDTATASISILLVPVFGLILSVIFLDEALTASMIAGSILILSGVFITQFSDFFDRKIKRTAAEKTDL